jgi:hypothetical protein
MSQSVTIVKHQNCDQWLNPIMEKRPKLAMALALFHETMTEADNIADGLQPAKYVTDCLWRSMSAMEVLAGEGPEIMNRICERIGHLAAAEQQAVRFDFARAIDVEKDIAINFEKGRVVELFFEAWCIIDPSLDTAENWEWIKHYREFLVIMDDIHDIESDQSEDLINARRNFIALSSFGYKAYQEWENKLSDMQKYANQVKTSFILYEPPCEALSVFAGLKKTEVANA